MTPAEMVALVNGDNLGVRMIVNACASRLIDEAEARPGTPEFAGILEAARCLHRLSDEISALGKNERPVLVDSDEACPVCDGRGTYSQLLDRYERSASVRTSTCSECGGTGGVVDESFVTPGILAELSEVSK